MEQEQLIKQKYEALKPYLDERTRRMWAAAEAQLLGHGGISLVARARGLTRKTIRAGLREQEARRASGEAPAPRQRRQGASYLAHSPRLVYNLGFVFPQGARVIGVAFGS